MKALLRRLRPGPHGAGNRPIRSIGRSHVGRVRRINEDRVLDRADLGLWAVADGMGGQSRGDMAAEAVIRSLAPLPAPVTPAAISAALRRANRTIYDAEAGRSGTTLVLLHIQDEAATLRWVGDSRAYLIREGRLELLTRDHSVVQELLETGLIDRAQAATHPQANVITRALGIGVEPEIDSRTLHLQRGDRLLLCSDGLSRSLEDGDAQGTAPIAELADRLLANALARDGTDNASLVLVEVGGD
ncbi:conserved hypothetical protein [Altererythrobacter sp. B11]|uniref:PP2C family protein-serine/threonine phosphatase n=1 Tax=Altererythrobacter sp. B11 TaxID=2060312 RepID=UPI000DC706F5|nr:protein phosphatase 2C domain-containing protein [Altererythrobacter sp. B11]BBC73648.1 conserved hypothetical protein [Altererythrobacter sp. B11]